MKVSFSLIFKLYHRRNNGDLVIIRPIRIRLYTSRLHDGQHGWGEIACVLLVVLSFTMQSFVFVIALFFPYNAEDLNVYIVTASYAKQIWYAFGSSHVTTLFLKKTWCHQLLRIHVSWAPCIEFLFFTSPRYRYMQMFLKKTWLICCGIWLHISWV